MKTFAITVHTAETEKAFRRLKDKAPIAIARALNRAAASATTAMIRVISEDTGIKQKDLRGTTKRNRAIWASDASPLRLQVRVYASTERIPLMDFNAKGKYPSRGKGRGVTAGLKNGSKRYPHAFLARMHSGHEGVFQRVKGEKRRSPKRFYHDASGEGRLNSSQLGIYELMGPSLARVWSKRADVGQQRAQEQLAKNLAHEFKFVASQQ